MTMMHIVNPENHTKEIGSYSASISIGIDGGKMVFISGQVPSDESGNTVGTTMKEQAEYVFQNLSKVLDVNGGTLKNLVSVTIFLKNIIQFNEFNEVRNDYFSEYRPASTLVEVSSLAINDHMVEINGIAYIK